MSTLTPLPDEPEWDDEFDPEPEKPEEPDDHACCHSGCQPCVWDFYDSAVIEYREKLAAWQVREARRKAGSRQ